MTERVCVGPDCDRTAGAYRVWLDVGVWLCRRHAIQLRDKGTLSPIRRMNPGRICEFGRTVATEYQPCEREVRSRGLCGGHAQQRDSGRPLTPVKSGTTRLCGFPGCERRVIAHGLCQGHAKQQREGKDLRPLRDIRSSDQCSFPGCARPHESNGLCNSHNYQRRNGQDLRPIREGRKPKEACTYPECDAPQVAKKLCRAHYGQQHRGQELRPRRGSTTQVCAVDDCSDKMHSYGYCSFHANRFRKHGDPTFNTY